MTNGWSATTRLSMATIVLVVLLLLSATVTFWSLSDVSSEHAWRQYTLVFLLAVSLGTSGLILHAVNTLAATLRTTAGQLRDGSEEVLMAAAQVAASAQVLSQGATGQASSLEDTSASMEEMASMTPWCAMASSV